MDELKPCPFCGSDELRISKDKIVRCINDECGFSYSLWETFWNTRPIEDALQQRVEELETNIREAVEEIELEWLYGVAGADGNRDDVYQSGAGKVLDILRKHGLITEDK